MAAPDKSYQQQIVGPDGATIWDPTSAPTGAATAANQTTIITDGIGLHADARNGKLTSGLWTLAAGIVESVTVPSWARGFRLRPSADIRFAISEDPVAAGTGTLTVGATAFAGESEVRLLETVSGTVTVRMLATGATTVQVSFF